MKTKPKPVDGKKLIEETKQTVKNNKKENNNMKKTTIITVVITLVAVASLAGMFLLGMSYNQSVNDRVHNEAKALSAVVAEQSKK